MAFTAHAVEGFREQCLNAGMNDYIVKPITASTAAGVLPATITVGNTLNLATNQTITGLGIPAGTRISGREIAVAAAIGAAQVAPIWTSMYSYAWFISFAISFAVYGGLSWRTT